MLKVWGRATSSNVQKVMWAVGELALPHERIDVGGAFGGVDTPEYRAMNPNGLIPVIEDRGRVIWESNAIVRYLAEQYGAGSLWPEDTGARAVADQWMDWVLTTLGPAFGQIFVSLIRTPPSKQDPKVIRAAAAHTGQVLSILDAHLAGTDYVTGPDLTMGDIAFGAILFRYFTLEIERPGLPSLEAYYGRLTQRPAFREHVMIPYDSLRAKD